MSNLTDPNPILESAAFLPLKRCSGVFRGFGFRADPFGVVPAPFPGLLLVLLAGILLFQGMGVVQTEGHKQGREQGKLCSDSPCKN